MTEPPRLVAIGLRPTLLETPPAIAEREGTAPGIDWQAKVDVAKADRRTHGT